MFLKVIGIVYLISIISTSACMHNSKDGFLPENNMFISENEKTDGGISKEEFFDIINNVEAIYAPVVKELGGELVVDKRWDDGKVNAFAKRDDKIYNVYMFGGLARHETITTEGFALVMCHELGHHIGGAPRKVEDDGKVIWASNEGQADYWATTKCLRKYFKRIGSNEDFVLENKIDILARLKCALSHVEDEEQAVCQRIMMAGKSVARLFDSASRKNSDPSSFYKKDSRIVTKTYDDHPVGQCRLDTYSAGALCHVEETVDVDSDDPNIGTCNRDNKDKVGIRPLCWFKPENVDKKSIFPTENI